MQIEIFSPTQAQPLPPVQWNYAEIKAWLEDGLQAYKGRVYTEDTITDAKKDRATLNKLKDAIAGKRREVKQTYLVPYETFEAQSKELEAMIAEQSAQIDAQVKAFDDLRKQERRKEIEASYAIMAGKLAELVPYERLHNPKWLNVTASKSQVNTELAGKVDQIVSGLASIDSLSLAPDIAERVKSVFLKNFDLAAALAERERIEKEREKLARYAAAQREQKARDVVAAPAETRTVAQATTDEQMHAVDDSAIYTVIFKCEATAAQLNALKAFLNNNNIKYGRA